MKRMALLPVSAAYQPAPLEAAKAELTLLKDAAAPVPSVKPVGVKPLNVHVPASVHTLVEAMSMTRTHLSFLDITRSRWLMESYASDEGDWKLAEVPTPSVIPSVMNIMPHTPATAVMVALSPDQPVTARMHAPMKSATYTTPLRSTATPFIVAMPAKGPGVPAVRLAVVTTPAGVTRRSFCMLSTTHTLLRVASYAIATM